MNGLRIYINPSGADAPGKPKLFYSRRADGPYYRWLYKEELGQWQVSRVRLSDLTLRFLCSASWDSVPLALQSKLGQHYLE
ncbi:MAG TPA: hypothetical protein VJT82_01095 [Pyrinomonadaceae bacterium]|nr:hypothetical protein [Pyrinomonadaceae bacterium]